MPKSDHSRLPKTEYPDCPGRTEPEKGHVWAASCYMGGVSLRTCDVCGQKQEGRMVWTDVPVDGTFG